MMCTTPIDLGVPKSSEDMFADAITRFQEAITVATAAKAYLQSRTPVNANLVAATDSVRYFALVGAARRVEPRRQGGRDRLREPGPRRVRVPGVLHGQHDGAAEPDLRAAPARQQCVPAEHALPGDDDRSPNPADRRHDGEGLHPVVALVQHLQQHPGGRGLRGPHVGPRRLGARGAVHRRRGAGPDCGHAGVRQPAAPRASRRQ